MRPFKKMSKQEAHDFLHRGDPMPTSLMATTTLKDTVDSFTCGWLFRWGSCWVGFHWSSYNKRICLNLLPFITFWMVFKGGKIP